MKTDSAPFILSAHGQPLFRLVLPANPSPTEEFAAEELTRTLYTIIGAPARSRHSVRSGLPRIFLNQPDAAAAAGIDVAGLRLEAEMFHLETRANDLHLLGGGPRGVMYGVYEILSALGCRWYTPELSHIPSQPNLNLPRLRLTSGPAFENRDHFNSDCADPLWRVRNRMNGGINPVPAYMGGSVDYHGFVHTFYALLPPEQYFETHPEYYSLVGGQRRREWAQLCLTNPAVLRLVTARVLELMHEHPRATIFSVSQNDCYGYCECPACTAVAEEEGSQSGPVIRFVNAIAEVTSQQFPEKLIDTLAYQYTLDAPRKTVPHRNVRVRLCSITCCQGHTYGTCAHPESLRFLHALEGWSRLKTQMYIWHYATDFGHYPVPMPDFDELHGNINLYQKHGVRGLFIQGMGEPGGGAESMPLRGFVLSRLLWQPAQPVWPLVDEFLAAFYGAAASGVRRYLDIFHDAVRRDRNLHPSLFDLPSSPQFAPKLVKPAEKALTEAEEAVRGAERKRIQLLRGGLRYARLYQASGSYQLKGDQYAGTATADDLREMDDLVRLWRGANIQRVREAEDFDFSVQLLRNRLRPHEVTWLQDGQQRIAVVPGLGGRIVSWQAGGRELLAPTVPDHFRSILPYTAGYAEFVQPEMYIRRGWAESYKSTWADGRLRLSATVGNGLRFSRTLWLEDGALHMHSHLRNPEVTAAEIAWGAEVSYLLDAASLLSFQDAAGPSSVWGELEPGVQTNLTAERMPQGEWQLQVPAGRLVHRFSGAELISFNLQRLADPLRLNVGWRTPMVKVEAGQSIRFALSVHLER